MGYGENDLLRLLILGDLVLDFDLDLDLDLLLDLLRGDLDLLRVLDLVLDLDLLRVLDLDLVRERDLE